MSDKETNGHASERDDNANVWVAFDDVKSQYFLTIRLMAPLVGLIQTGTSTSAYILNATQFRGVLYTRVATMGRLGNPISEETVARDAVNKGDRS